MSLTLDIKYVHQIGPYLKLFKQKDKDLWTYRCPICGDSKSSKFKTRGYIYRSEGKFFAKCHNCGYSAPFGKLLKDVAPDVHREYMLESLMEFGEKPKFIPVVKQEKAIIKKDELERFCIKLSKLDDSHYAKRYYRARKLPEQFLDYLYHAHDYRELTAIFTKYADKELREEPRLVIPFYDRGGNLIAVQGRSYEKNSKLRYLTFKHDEDAPLIFGYERLNLSKHIYSCEGPLDSLFIDNCCAIAGSDFAKVSKLFAKNKLTLIFDNEPRKPEVVKKYVKFQEAGYSIVVFPKEIKVKDINNMVESGLTKDKILDIINKNTYNDLTLKLKIADWKRCDTTKLARRA